MKRVRQNKILELIGEYDIDTQEELGKRLHESVFRMPHLASTAVSPANSAEPNA